MENIKRESAYKEAEENSNPLEKIKNEEIAALYQPIENIIEKIKNNIENGEYGLIIGEDTSGRIPALVFNKVLKAAYEKKGQPSPDILFMSGIRWYNPQHDSDKEKGERFIDHIKDHVVTNEKKALVVTEYIKFGHSILPIVHALEAQGIPYDIAACVVADVHNEAHPRNKHHPRYAKEIADHLYYGIDGEEVESMDPNSPLRRFAYNRTTELSGVARNQGDLLSQHANNHVPKNETEGKALYDQAKINEARKDVETLANILIEKNFNS